jgi:membrane fusion protein, multidrug efflux system
MEKRKIPAVGIAFLVIVAFVGAIGVKYWLNTSVKDQQWGGMGPTPVVAKAVLTISFANSVEALGTARANESVDIMAKVTDTVRSIGFDDSQVVERGAILIELTDIEETAGLAEARASLSEANKQYARIKVLVQDRTATQARLDTAESERGRARARVQALEAKLADRIIRAPFSGVLGLRQVSVGSLVRPGDLITTLDDISIVKVDFSVSERYLAAVGKGQMVEATNVAYPGQVFNGEVKSVESRIDPVTRAVTVRAHFSNDMGLLRPGMLLSMTLIIDRREALAISEASIIPIKDDAFVYVVSADGTADKRKIETGMRQAGMVEVLKGLEKGEVVVVEGTSRIRRPGQKVSTDGASKGGPKDARRGSPKDRKDQGGPNEHGKTSAVGAKG